MDWEAFQGAVTNTRETRTFDIKKLINDILHVGKRLISTRNIIILIAVLLCATDHKKRETTFFSANMLSVINGENKLQKASRKQYKE